MRKQNCLKAGLIAALTGTLLAGQWAMADVVLVQDGKAATTIYVPAGSMAELPKPDRRAPGGKGADPNLPAIQTAVREINYHLKKMSGAELPVVEVMPDAVIAPDAGGIYLGLKNAGRAPELKAPTVSKESFRLIAEKNRVAIQGESNRAVLIGTYDMLNRLGIDWVMPGEIGEVIPAQKTVTLKDVDSTQSPDFPVRMLWYRGFKTKFHPTKPGEYERFAEWIQRERGGRTEIPEGQVAGHYWQTFIKNHQAEFDKDPTMYAYRKNRLGEMVRTGPQIETTHPRVIELFVEDIKNEYKKKIAAGEWTKDSPAGFPIGPADGLGYSVSEESKKAGSGVMDPIVGDWDVTDLLVLLGNSILKEVHKEYPNAYVGFYSYSTHASYPVKYTPNPKLAIIFAPINFSRFHGVNDENSYTQAWYRDVLAKWGELSNKQGNPLIFRGFNWNLAENLMPYTKVRIWGEDLPFYKKANMLGVNVEATKQWGTLGPSDWVFMKLAWNTNQDWKVLLKRYCQLAYGDGGELMEKYNLMLLERQSNAKQEAGSYYSFPLIYDAKFVEEALALFDQAAALAQKPEEKTRILYARQPVESLKLYLEYFEAAKKFDFALAKERYEALKKQWAAGYEMNSDVVSNEANAYFIRFLEKFVVDGAMYSSAPYKILYALPDELPTKFDKDEVGHLLKYQNVEYNEAHWSKTKTYSSTWHAQGLAKDHRVGAVWYRTRFTAPAALEEGQGVGLFIGACEDEARVWVNGEFIGSSGQRFSAPSTFDLTSKIKAGEENVIAIMIVRNSAANEIGLGGILRESFVFTGPRLKEQASKKDVEMRRILPGGELGEIEK
jgi:hypothetical protein